LPQNTTALTALLLYHKTRKSGTVATYIEQYENTTIMQYSMTEWC